MYAPYANEMNMFVWIFQFYPHISTLFHEFTNLFHFDCVIDFEAFFVYYKSNISFSFCKGGKLCYENLSRFIA